MYKFISDAGHGWLRVPKSECEGLVFSTYSYTDGHFLYLEEDCDAGIFMEAKRLTEREINWTNVDDLSRIRDLPHIQYEKNSDAEYQRNEEQAIWDENFERKYE